VRAFQVARRLPALAREQRPHLAAMCEVAGMLASGVGVPAVVADHLAYLTERWDGTGPLRRAKGEQIPLPMRIVHVAVDAAFQRLLGGVEHAARMVRDRAGAAFDPEVAACLTGAAGEILAPDERGSAWEETLARERLRSWCSRAMGSIARWPRWATSRTSSRRIWPVIPTVLRGSRPPRRDAVE
jgi:hypothetical protein